MPHSIPMVQMQKNLIYVSKYRNENIDLGVLSIDPQGFH